jgi:hypothetical protein
LHRKDRARLVADILHGLARLREDTTLPAADEAHEIACHMVNSLAMGDSPFGFEPGRVKREQFDFAGVEAIFERVFEVLAQDPAAPT